MYPSRNCLETSIAACKCKNHIKSRFNADLSSSISSMGLCTNSTSNSSGVNICRPVNRFEQFCINPNDSSGFAITQCLRSKNSGFMGSANSQSSDWSSGNGNGNSRNNSPKLGSSYRSHQHDMPNDSQQTYTSGQSSNLKETIPAFALHPSGLHYVPIVMHAYALHRHFNESGFINSVGSCHLISIPVSIGGAFLMARTLI